MADWSCSSARIGTIKTDTQRVATSKLLIFFALFTMGLKNFSRKAAKAKEAFRKAAALCFFAPLRESFSVVTELDQSGSNPRRVAIVTACVRSFAPSLSTMFLI